LADEVEVVKRLFAFSWRTWGWSRWWSRSYLRGGSGNPDVFKPVSAGEARAMAWYSSGPIEG
jgi:hypothetical protein